MISRRLTADTWVALVLLVVCGFFLKDLLATEGSGAYTSTTDLPIMLVLVLAVLSLILLGGSLLRPVAVASKEPATNESMPGLLRVAVMVIWIGVYIVALPWFGYLLSSFIFLAGSTWFYGNRKPVSIAAIALMVPLVLLLFFEKFMIVLLPSSRLFG